MKAPGPATRQQEQRGRLVRRAPAPQGHAQAGWTSRLRRWRAVQPGLGRGPRSLAHRRHAWDGDGQTVDDQRVSTMIRQAGATTMGKRYSPARPWRISGTGPDQDVSMARARSRRSDTGLPKRVGRPVHHGQEPLLGTLVGGHAVPGGSARALPADQHRDLLPGKVSRRSHDRTPWSVVVLD
jgi:hypothetical protein